MENRYDYAMDEFGNLENRTGTNNNGVAFETRDLTANPSTNRLEGKFYDILGNLKQTTNEDGIDLTLIYMDQGHVAEVVDPDSGDTLFRYYYDAGGQRRIKARGDSSDGIMDNVSFAFYAGNDLICQLDRGEEIQDDKAYQPKFLLLDHLGTTRAELKFVEDAGDLIPTITAGYDVLPYGEMLDEWHAFSSPIEDLPEALPTEYTEQVLFTGKPRDKESGLDYFGARFYGNNLLRWTSPDQPFVDNHIGNPQSWNLYSYVRCNPIVNVDNNGMYILSKKSVDKKTGIIDVRHGRPVYKFKKIVKDSLAYRTQAARVADAGLEATPGVGGIFAILNSRSMNTHNDTTARTIGQTVGDTAISSIPVAGTAKSLVSDVPRAELTAGFEKFMADSLVGAFGEEGKIRESNSKEHSIICKQGGIDPNSWNTLLISDRNLTDLIPVFEKALFKIWKNNGQSSDVNDYDNIKTMLQGINEKQSTENK